MRKTITAVVMGLGLLALGPSARAAAAADNPAKAGSTSDTTKNDSMKKADTAKSNTATGAAATGSAETAKTGTETKTAKAEQKQMKEETELIQKLHFDNKTEIEMGKLAQEKGQSQEVKDFGKMLETDHSDADKKVVELAQKKNITLEETPTSKDLQKEAKETEQVKTKLSSLPADKFDKEFLAAMNKDHKKTIAEVEKAQKKLTDPDVKTFLGEVLPTLHKHHLTAQTDMKQTGKQVKEKTPPKGRRSSDMNR